MRDRALVPGRFLYTRLLVIILMVAFGVGLTVFSAEVAVPVGHAVGFHAARVVMSWR